MGEIAGPMPRRKTVAVKVGEVTVGGGAPVVVQSMTNTDTADVEATVAQVTALARTGSELVRVTVDRDEAAAALPRIKDKLLARGITTPIVFVTPMDMALASSLGTYPSLSAAWSTRSRASSLAEPRPESTLAAVAFDTIAARATSAVVTESRLCTASIPPFPTGCSPCRGEGLASREECLRPGRRQGSSPR